MTITSYDNPTMEESLQTVAAVIEVPSFDRVGIAHFICTQVNCSHSRAHYWSRAGLLCRIVLYLNLHKVHLREAPVSH